MNDDPAPTGAPPPAPHPEDPARSGSDTRQEPRDTGPRVTAAEARDLSRLRRSSTDRHVAGVAGGLGRHLDIDPVVLRVLFVVTTLTGGAGLLFYLACWLLVPSDDEPRAAIDLDGRSRNAALWIVTGIAALAAFGAMVGDPFPWDEFWVPVPLLLLAVLVWLLLRGRGRSEVPPPGTPEVAAHGEPPAAYHPPARPRDPRKRGPLLFWPTMALAALGIGVLGLVDVAGADAPDSAYPALVLATCGVMLVVGAFWGRAGGLVLVGLVAALATAAATAADRWEEGVHHAPVTAVEVRDDYDMGAGELVLDLTRVDDLEALDGRLVDIEGGVGRLEVVVPDTGLDVVATGHVGGPGHVVVFGSEAEGIDSRRTASHDGGDDAPELTIDAELGVGEVSVHSASEDPSRDDRFEDRRNR